MSHETARKRYPKPLDFRPVPSFPDDHRHSGYRRCQAWNPNQGRQCLNIAMRGGDKCRVHGGKSLRGIASPSLTTGIYSKYLATGLLPHYQDALSDTELLSLRDDIALLQARQIEIIENLDKMPSGEVWKELNKAYTDFDRANRRQDADAAAEAINQIRALIKRGLKEWLQWDEIMQIQEQKRKLGESERKRLTEMQQLIDVKTVALRVNLLMESIRKNVSDPEALLRIQNDYERFILRQTDL